MKKYPWWKAFMDYLGSTVAIILLFPFLLFLFAAASVDTGFPGIFRQERIGRAGRIFVIYKFQTYHRIKHTKSPFGMWLRKTKLDELPQLFNILFGDMSIVGPRPDIPGYYDRLEGEDRLILELKPGLTSEAGIKFKNEEALLVLQENPQKYNDDVLFPEKVRLNLRYYRELGFNKDVFIIWETIKTIFKS